MSAVLGASVPDVRLPATGGQHRALGDFRGQQLVLFFYPKAHTAGCTQEGRDFAAAAAEFAAINTAILGVSRDSLKTQERFKAAQGFPFELLSDRDEVLCQWFGTIAAKIMFGKPVRGLERSTFLIDATGVVRQEWRRVQVAGHVAAVLAAARALAGAA